jgi:hypothetical protein
MYDRCMCRVFGRRLYVAITSKRLLLLASFVKQFYFGALALALFGAGVRCSVRAEDSSEEMFIAQGKNGNCWHHCRT